MAAVRTAVVTGTARPHGIGRATARAFVAAGWQVLGVDKVKMQQPEQDTTLQSRYHHIVLDITRPEECAYIPPTLQKQFGSSAVHAVVNNAGIADPHLPDNPKAALERWHAVISTNLTGAFLVCQALLPHVPAGDAAFVHISSTRALQSEPHCEAYAAAKAGLLGLTHAQAASLAGRVRVNAVLPGWIETTGDPSSLTPEDHAWHWAGRVGRPEDVADMVLFLADGTRSGFITGQQFVVDGGVSRKMVYPEEAAEEQQARAQGGEAQQPQQQQRQGGSLAPPAPPAFSPPDL